MAKPRYLILAGPQWQLAAITDSGVHVAALPASSDQLDAKAAAQVVAAMRQADYRGGPLVLGIPSAWTLVGTVSTDKLPRGNRRQALLYRLEEQLPLPAEALSADFAESAGKALGVAVQTERLQATLQELENAGIAIQAIVPSAVLALQAAAAANPIRGRSYLALRTPSTSSGQEAGGQLELAVLDSGRLIDWHSADDGAAFLTALRMDLVQQPARDEPVPLVACGLDQPLRDALARQEEIKVQLASAPPAAELAAQTTARLLAGKARPWLDLRRGGLASSDRLGPVRRPLQVGAALLVLLLGLAAGGLLLRSWQADRAADELLGRQEAIFCRLYPGKPVPAAVRWRLESDARRLGALRGLSANTPQRVSALELLRQVTAGLPGNVRFQLEEIRLEPGGIFLDGQVRTHSDAQSLATELGKNKMLAVEPPKTEQLPKEGVAFTLSAKVQPAGKAHP